MILRPEKVFDTHRSQKVLVHSIMSVLLKIEAKLDAVNKRLEAAQQHLATIHDEKRKLDAAYGVVTDILGEDGNGTSGQNDSHELTNPGLIMKILGESPRALRPSEIRDIALKEYGREIPPATSSAALAYAKKAGRLTNSDGTWLIATGHTEKSVTPNDAPSPPQQERSDPVERETIDGIDDLL